MYRRYSALRLLSCNHFLEKNKYSNINARVASFIQAIVSKYSILLCNTLKHCQKMLA